MAEDKKSVILYVDLINTFEELSDEEAGRLIKHFFRYVNDKDPEPPDRITKIAFEPIKQQLKRDLSKWQNIRKKRSEAGKISADKRQHMSTHVESVQQTPTNSTVNVTATVNVNDNVINEEVEGEKKINDFTTNQKWKDEFCMAKNISPPELERLQKEFITEKKLKGESVNNYKRYFVFWYEKRKNGTHKQPVKQSGKPGKSAGANILLGDVKQEYNTGSG
jgi:hypothetical protein